MTDVYIIIQTCAFVGSTVVSIGTGCLIYKTLVLQGNMASNQAKVTKLEFDRFQIEKKPLFFGKRIANVPIADSQIFYYNYELELLRDDIKEYSCELVFSDGLKNSGLKVISEPIKSTQNGLIEGTRFQLTYSLDQIKVQELYGNQPVPHGELRITLNFSFTDAKKIKYKQIITIDNEKDPFSLPPEMT